MPREGEPQSRESGPEQPDLLFERYLEEERILDLFENGEIIGVENIDDVQPEIRAHANGVYLAQLKHRSAGFRVVFAGQEIQGIFKPLSGEDLEKEKRDWGINDFYKKEAATYFIDRALGFGLTPPTAVREVEVEGKREIGSLRLYIPPEQADVWYLNDFYDQNITRFTETLDWQTLAAFDYLIANGDRHLDNILFSTGEPCQIYPIDNGFSLVPDFINPNDVAPKGPRAKMAFKEIENGVFEPRENQLPAEIRSQIVEFNQDRERKARLTDQLIEIGLPENEIEELFRRINKMAKSGQYY